MADATSENDIWFERIMAPALYIRQRVDLFLVGPADFDAAAMRAFMDRFAERHGFGLAEIVEVRDRL